MSKITELKNIIKDAQSELVEIQSACSHPKSCVTSKYWRATDEYGTTTTAQGYNNTCSLCEGNWSSEEDASR